MEINFGERTMNIPGCSEWTEEQWEKFAAAIGATLVPLSEEEEGES